MTCVVPGCDGLRKKRKLFSAPYNNKSRLENWLNECPFLRNIDSGQLRTVKFCSLHFQPEHINDQNRLTNDAVPSLRLPEFDIKRSLDLSLEKDYINLKHEKSDKLKEIIDMAMSEPFVKIQKESEKGKCVIINPGLCRCCRSIKKCRLLTSEYDWIGNKEIYSDMFVDCFGLLLSHLDGEDTELGVCATCVSRLRDASAFRQQVLQCEQVFLSARLENKEEVTQKVELESVDVKPEPLCDDGVESMDDGLAGSDPDFTLSDIEDSKPLKKIMKEAKTKTKNSKRVIEDGSTKIRRVRKKADRILDKPIKLEREAKPTRAKRKETTDRDHLVYTNTIAIVRNSYVCPFLNRISNYYCYYCKDQFVNPIELRDHTLSHDPNDFENMMENKKIPKIDITRIDCRLCDAKIEDIDSFKRHVTTAHSIVIHPVGNEFLKFRLTVNNLVCTECEQTFPYFDLLKKHMIDHFGTFICDQCGACFLEQNSLRTHIKSHSKTESNFPCEVCGKNLKSKYSRYLHIATVHEKKATVNCYKCEASFLSYALRNRHLIEVHGDKRTFPCKLCDKVYNRRKTLMEHNRRNHLKVYRHQCDLCDQRFYLPSRLREHMATHTGERNYRCELCDKTYPRLQSLQEHLRSHGPDRKYKCDQCDSAFSQNCSLKNHAKLHHQSFDIETSFS